MSNVQMPHLRRAPLQERSTAMSTFEGTSLQGTTEEDLDLTRSHLRVCAAPGVFLSSQPVRRMVFQVKATPARGRGVMLLQGSWFLE